MSGVEAAASLFGSDDPASDPFATLGTDTAVTASAGDFFSSEQAPLFAENNADPFELSGQTATYPATNSTYPDYAYSPETQAVAGGYNQYSDAQDPYAGQSDWTGHDQGAGSNYSIPPEPQAPVSTTNYTKSYTPQNYAIPAPEAVQQPPASTPNYVNSYTPQTYAPAAPTYSAYGSYDPPAPTNYYPTTSTTKSPVQPTYISPLAGLTKSGAVPAPPRPATSTVSRPKVSNAYDPPFLATKPSRRSVRGTGAQQAYNAYQSAPLPPASVPAPANLASNASGGYFQAPAPPGPERRQASPSIPSGPPHPPLPVRSSTGSYNNAHHPAMSPYEAEPFPANIESSLLQQDQPEITDSPAFSQSNGFNGSSTPERYASPPVSGGPPSGRSHTPQRSSIGSNSSLLKSEKESIEAAISETTSPSMIPLPYSPPVAKVDLQSFDAPGDHESGVKSSPPYVSPYAPSQIHKKETAPTKEMHDPYAPPPAAHYPNNYIPRTASPLQKEYNPTTARKTSVTLTLNGAAPSPYNAIPRNVAVPAPPPPIPALLGDGLAARHALGLSQEISVRHTASQYAPSPSLLGANDPLSRTSARAPVITFGFGGKMVTCFHGMPGLNTGFDVALSARTSSELKIRVLQKILPESTLGSPGSSYPGPLVSDPGTSALSIVRPGAAATQTRAKKAGLLTYLSTRADEVAHGLGYLPPPERMAAEDKLILIKILKVLIEHDGRLLGTPQAEAAVRAALVPRLEGEQLLQDAVSLQAAYQSASLHETPLSVTSLLPSSLSKIEDLLLHGDRRQAYQYALDQKLWSHAMVIASSIDKESWKEAVQEFLRSELSSHVDQIPGAAVASMHATKTSHESLRVAYSLFSGQGAAAVQELAPPTSLQNLTSGLLQPPAGPAAVSAMTPRTPNFAAMQPPLNIPAESLAKWAETVAMIISSPMTSDVSGTLTALGDQLLGHNWVSAAHVCYLLSPQTSLVGGLGAPGVRMTLVGSKTPGTAFKDPDALVFSEILEFSMSLVPTIKGQDYFHGLPHLQAYRFMRAVWLVEMGDVQLANRYCEAIAASLGQNSPYSTSALLEQLHGLQQRLTGMSHSDKASSWIGSKLSKPSLDSIGGWLEGRFTQIVTGGADSPNPNADQKLSTQQFGPFAHYSTISSTTPSARSSPQPPPLPPNFSVPPPPQRTTSAMATSSPYGPSPVERSSSAMGYINQKPPLQTSDSSTYSFPSSQSSPTGYGLNGHSRDGDPYASKSHTTSESQELETPVQGNNWWGSDENQSNQTPTAATFMPVQDSSAQPSSDGFISLMDNQSFAFESQPPSRQASRAASNDFDDDDDLGLGNGRPKVKAEAKEGNDTTPAKDNAAPPPKVIPEKPPVKPAADNGGGSWLGRWWKRPDSTTPGPVKASLGEESAFYYDKELKKWVNKKAGGEDAAKPSTPPPPPRAQTASPGMSGSRPPLPPAAGTGPPARSSSVGGGPPPPRPSSAIDLSTEPPSKVPPRIRSNLAPPTAESLPSTPTTPGNGPPSGRPRSQASKRAIRSRYVDLFAQEAGGGTPGAS